MRKNILFLLSILSAFAPPKGYIATLKEQLNTTQQLLSAANIQIADLRREVDQGRERSRREGARSRGKQSAQRRDHDKEMSELRAEHVQELAAMEVRQTAPGWGLHCRMHDDGRYNCCIRYISLRRWGSARCGDATAELEFKCYCGDPDTCCILREYDSPGRPISTIRDMRDED